MGIGIFKIFDVAADGLSSQRLKMNTVSENIANAETTRTASGGPYRRQRVVFKAPTRAVEFSRELQSATLKMRRTRGDHIGPNPGVLQSFPGAPAAVSATTVAAPVGDVKLVFDPSHPDADSNGYVAMPDINVVTEMVDLMAASRAYEANLTTVEAVKSMVSRALNI